jgi:acetoin utilization deacetylase AcuC-like enzyme
MISYCLVRSPDHTLAGHPENEARLQHFQRRIFDLYPDQTESIAPQPISLSHLAAVHPPHYLDRLQSWCQHGPAYVDPAPTYVTPASYQAALLAAGGTLQVLEAVLSGPADHGFALIRPPGHHATQDQAMGFCLLNNIALTARRAQALGRQRVMIVDFDVHHGNGTQDIFEQDPDIFYLSTHQFGIYPGSGDWRERGNGEGLGKTMNIPLPSGVGDAGFSSIFERLISPAARAFEPALLLVSAGFDAHWRDPLAGLTLTEAGYYRMAAGLKDLARELCDGHIVFVLEGGYDPSALAGSVEAVFRALLGEPAPGAEASGHGRPEPPIADLLDRLRRLHNLEDG